MLSHRATFYYHLSRAEIRASRFERRFPRAVPKRARARKRLKRNSRATELAICSFTAVYRVQKERPSPPYLPGFIPAAFVRIRARTPDRMQIRYARDVFSFAPTNARARGLATSYYETASKSTSVRKRGRVRRVTTVVVVMVG